MIKLNEVESTEMASKFRFEYIENFTQQLPCRTLLKQAINIQFKDVV